MDDPTKEKTELIVNKLKESHGVGVVFLVGSRAVGDYYPNSDWDMFALTDRMNVGESYEDFISREGYPEYPGEYLQVVILPITQKFDRKVFGLKLRFSELVYDTDNLGKNILKDAHAAYDEGPKTWNKEYALSRIPKANGYMEKIERLWKDGKQGHAFAYMCYHYTDNILPWWFAIRGEWPLRPQQTFPYIKNKDPEFYSQLERVFTNTTNEEKIEAFKVLQRLLFESKEFKEIVGAGT